MRKTVAVLAVLMACASIGSGHGVKSLSARLLVMDAPGDSVDVTLSWNPVTDGVGQPISYYSWEFVGNGVILDMGDTTGLSVTRRFARLVGDTLRLQGRVAAVDSRGVRGATGFSNIIPIFKEIPPPVAPEVQLDTIPLGFRQMDSIRIFTNVERGADGRYHPEIGETIQFCTVAWDGETAFRPLPQAPACLDMIPQFHNLLWYPAGPVKHSRQAD